MSFWWWCQPQHRSNTVERIPLEQFKFVYVSFVEHFANGIAWWIQFHFFCSCCFLCVFFAIGFWLFAEFRFQWAKRICFLIPSKLRLSFCVHHVRIHPKHSMSRWLWSDGSLGKYLNSFDRDRHQCHRHYGRICVMHTNTKAKHIIHIFIYLLPKTNECHLAFHWKYAYNFLC